MARRQETLVVAFLLFYLFLSPVLAQEDRFSVEPSSITNSLGSLRIYQDKLTIYSQQEQVITAEIKCSEDISCQWASFAFATGRETSIDLPFVENETYPLYVEVLIPEEYNHTQHEFVVVLSTPGQITKIPYTLKISFIPNPIESFIMQLDDFYNSIYYEFPNSQVPPVTGATLIFILIGAVAIIFIVRKVRS